MPTEISGKRINTVHLNQEVKIVFFLHVLFFVMYVLLTRVLFYLTERERIQSGAGRGRGSPMRDSNPGP